MSRRIGVGLDDPYAFNPPPGYGNWLDELTVTAPKLDDPLCAQVDGEIFFPEKGGSTRPAKSICKACPDREPCLEWALETGEQYGIYGGLAPQERRQLSRLTAAEKKRRIVRALADTRHAASAYITGHGPNAAPHRCDRATCDMPNRAYKRIKERERRERQRLEGDAA